MIHIISNTAITIILLAIFTVSGVISHADVELPLLERAAGVGEACFEVQAEDNSDACQFNPKYYVSLDITAICNEIIRFDLKNHLKKSIAIRAPPYLHS